MRSAGKIFMSFKKFGVKVGQLVNRERTTVKETSITNCLLINYRGFALQKAGQLSVNFRSTSVNSVDHGQPKTGVGQPSKVLIIKHLTLWLTRLTRLTRKHTLQNFSAKISRHYPASTLLGTRIKLNHYTKI
jgi:hypothetical protein